MAGSRWWLGPFVCFFLLFWVCLFFVCVCLLFFVFFFFWGGEVLVLDAFVVFLFAWCFVQDFFDFCGVWRFGLCWCFLLDAFMCVFFLGQCFGGFFWGEGYV